MNEWVARTNGNKHVQINVQKQRNINLLWIYKKPKWVDEDTKEASYITDENVPEIQECEKLEASEKDNRRRLK